MIVIQNMKRQKGYSVLSGMAIYWNGIAADLPDGWALDASAYDTLIKGAGEGTASNVVEGANTHKHSLSVNDVGAHTHTVSYSIGSPSSGGKNVHGSGNKVAASNHGHTKGNTTSGSGGAHGHGMSDTELASSLPPYKRMYLIKATEESLVPVGGIIMWNTSLGNKPDSYGLCNGTNGTPDLREKFIYVAAEDADVGDGGGASMDADMES